MIVKQEGFGASSWQIVAFSVEAGVDMTLKITRYSAVRDEPYRRYPRLSEATIPN